MAIHVRDVVKKMEAWAPSSLAYAWDNVGLQIGDLDAPVDRILVCLTITEEVVGIALREKISLIVAHHPIIFRPLHSLCANKPQERLCMELVRGGVACYVAHTNLDLVPGGVSYALADMLGITQVQPLFLVEHAVQYKFVSFVPETHLAAVRQAVSEAGAGIIGEYTQCSFSTPGTGTFLPGASATPFLGNKEMLNEEPERRFETIVPKGCLGAVIGALCEAHPYEEPAYDVFPLIEPDNNIGLGVRGVLQTPVTMQNLAELTCSLLEEHTVRVYGDADMMVRSVAVLGGSGGGEIPRLPSDIDLYITGDVKYHDALEALQRSIGVIDAGHRGTEIPVLEKIKEYLAQLNGLNIMIYEEPETFTVVSASPSLESN